MTTCSHPHVHTSRQAWAGDGSHRSTAARQFAQLPGLVLVELPSRRSQACANERATGPLGGLWARCFCCFCCFPFLSFTSRNPGRSGLLANIPRVDSMGAFQGSTSRRCLPGQLGQMSHCVVRSLCRSGQMIAAQYCSRQMRKTALFDSLGRCRVGWSQSKMG